MVPNGSDMSLYTVKVGTTVMIGGSCSLIRAHVLENGVYAPYKGSDPEYSYTACEMNSVLTLGSEHIGIWQLTANDWGHGCYLKVIAADGSSTEPDKPTEQPSTEPEQPTTPTTPEQPTTPPVEPAKPDAPGTYTVKKGDTWSSICINFYGSNGQRGALQKANKGVTLKEGAVITLPEKLGKDTLISAPVAGTGEKLYTVKAGDTLGKIAANQYGKVSEYKAIFERNADRLKNANTIYEGQVIVLPAK